ERHPHSQVIPGSAAERGMDATVAWNYIDLRFLAKNQTQIRVALTQTELVVQIRAETGKSHRVLLPMADSRTAIDDLAHSCVSCGRTECHREAGDRLSASEKTAWLLTEWWPEFDQIPAEDQARLFAPLDG